MSDRARIIGAYELLVRDERSEDGQPRPELAASVGRISYDAAGRVSVLIHLAERAAPRDPLAVTPEDYRAMGFGLVAYYGSYALDEAAGQIVHHVEAASNPQMIGRELVRRYQLTDERLTLSFRTSSLVWRRLAG